MKERSVINDALESAKIAHQYSELTELQES